MFNLMKLFTTLSFGMLLLVGSGDSSDTKTNTAENNTTNTTTNTISNTTTNSTTNTTSNTTNNTTNNLTSNTETTNADTIVEGVTAENSTTEDTTTEDSTTENSQNTVDTNNSNIWEVSNISEFRQALEGAAANGENDTIILAKGTYNVASDNKGKLEFDDEEEFNLTIVAEDGLNANDVILDGDNKHQIFNFDNRKATLSFKNISISNGRNTSDGAGVYSNANTIVENCIISNNDNDNKKGGGLYIGNSISIINSTFSKNNAWVGGGFYSPFGSYTSIKKSSFIDNTAGYGGAFSAYQVNVEDSDFTSNIAQRDGGAFGSQSTTIINSNFTNNSADKGFGGAINTGTTIINNSNFIKNNANTGGAIDTGKLTLINSYFSKNKANTYAIGHLRNISYISNNVFTDNQGSLKARGIFVNNIFNNNTEDLNIYADSKVYNNYIDENKVSENDHTVITKNNIQPSLGDILLSNDGMSLQTGSEAIDKGLNPDSDKYMEIIDNMTNYRVILDLLQTDKVGNKRVHNSTIDMGAVEFGSSK